MRTECHEIWASRSENGGARQAQNIHQWELIGGQWMKAKKLREISSKKIELLANQTMRTTSI